MPSTATATVTAVTLNIRPAAGATDAPALGQLKRGTHVDVLAREGDWYRISSGGITGFVHGDFIRLDSRPTIDGFLCHNDGLCSPTVGLQPPKQVALAGLKGNALMAAKAWNRYGGMLGPLCAETQMSPAAAVGVICVESSGQGMTDDGTLIIRFENHVFWDKWGQQNADAFRTYFTFDSAKRWTKQKYRLGATSPWKSSHDVGQAAEWEAFGIARRLNEPAAMQSISMGAPQIMGFNHAAIGYDAARTMFDRFENDERYHILGLFDFVKGGGATSRMLEALRREQYEQFATFYNGNGQAAVYGARIRAVASAFKAIAPV